MKYLYIFSLFFVFYACKPELYTASESTKKDTIVLYSSEKLLLPQGFKAHIIADDLGRGRHLTVKDNGDIYMILNRLNDKGYGIVALRKDHQDGTYDSIAYFGNFSGTGIKIHNGYLYASSDEIVYRYAFDDANNLIPNLKPEIIAEGFPEQENHRSKSFDFDEQGNLYVDVGSPSNACMTVSRTAGSPGLDPCPQLERHAGIWKFDANKTHQDQVKDGIRYATGIRNAVALSWNHQTNKLYVVQHGRDQLSQFFPKLYSEDDGVHIPAEEFLEINEGDDFGWPYCYYDGQKNKKLLAPEYGGDGQKLGRCQGKKDPILTFPAHVAPNDLLFYNGDQFPEKYKNGAFVAFHGSWNRAPQEQEGYYVVFIPFKNKRPTGEWEVFADGFKGTDTIFSPNDALHRPVGLAQTKTGSLLVSDSVKGTIWEIENIEQED